MGLVPPLHSAGISSSPAFGLPDRASLDAIRRGSYAARIERIEKAAAGPPETSGHGVNPASSELSRPRCLWTSDEAIPASRSRPPGHESWLPWKPSFPRTSCQTRDAKNERTSSAELTARAPDCHPAIAPRWDTESFALIYSISAIVLSVDFHTKLIARR